MSRKVYIQKRDDEWLSANQYSAMKGFDYLAYEVIPYTYEEMQSGLLQLNSDTIVHGGVASVLTALKLIGAPPPENINIPDVLKEFCGRQVFHTTMGLVRKLVYPVFIKPLSGHKDFNGHLVKVFRDLIYTASLRSDYVVLASEPVDFVSEYRFFVLKGKVIGVGHYWGDPLIFPDAEIVKKAVDKYTSSPVAYSIDFGIVEDGRTLLVEVNDAFALGSYGLKSHLYADMIEARWDEMVGKK